MILSGECKDRGSLVLDELRRILARVPKLTGIHLVTVQKLQDKYFTKKATTECEETAECKETTKCTELKQSTTDYTESEHHITKAKKSVTERTAGVESDAQSCAESNVPTGQVTPPPKPDVSKMSASKYLEHVGLQHADFYRISRSGEVQRFQELMEAKATGGGTRESGAGKLILVVEVGPISKKRRSNEAGQTESPNSSKKSRVSGAE
ncbi:hypothetical protein PHYSODRAFT_322663 [Phytophthora sojae]|uniref:Uncharacterized protein n=1 Tax=Phytophthora sojae (strain P6497) TaxID=1094619 RepID=G4YHJ6_PHYSP|nr:hypothetical protein PHYSODRAFT_322663 [Phytophthora sojae]EGZ29101.1 hypothetical protein PHYSODRAFT_322663 [Phytophthora sojae]|eukprot:XP_009516376.1 hypothetical protein PHYSODRAFT_322663 [Phytophthora sojae]